MSFARRFLVHFALPLALVFGASTAIAAPIAEVDFLAFAEADRDGGLTFANDAPSPLDNPAYDGFSDDGFLVIGGAFYETTFLGVPDLFTPNQYSLDYKLSFDLDITLTTGQELEFGDDFGGWVDLGTFALADAITEIGAVLGPIFSATIGQCESVPNDPDVGFCVFDGGVSAGAFAFGLVEDPDLSFLPDEALFLLEEVAPLLEHVETISFGLEGFAQLKEGGVQPIPEPTAGLLFPLGLLIARRARGEA